MKIAIIHGPNLNLLGMRETSWYGSTTLGDINNSLAKVAHELSIEIDFFQSNVEGELINYVQQCARNQCAGIVLNPAAYGHTSIGLRDALLACAIPFVEVHISNIYRREKFRQDTLLSDIASGVIVGFGVRGYELALRALVAGLNAD